jgi:hypothetical protein
MNPPVGWCQEQYAVPLCLISLHLIAYLITHNRIQFFASGADVDSIANMQMPSVEFLCRPKIQNLRATVASIVHLGPRDFLNRSRIAPLSHIELTKPPQHDPSFCRDASREAAKQRRSVSFKRACAHDHRARCMPETSEQRAKKKCKGHWHSATCRRGGRPPRLRGRIPDPGHAEPARQQPHQRHQPPALAQPGSLTSHQTPAASQERDKPVRSQEHDHPPAPATAPLCLRPAISHSRLSPL